MKRSCTLAGVAGIGAAGTLTLQYCIILKCTYILDDLVIIIVAEEAASLQRCGHLWCGHFDPIVRKHYICSGDHVTRSCILAGVAGNCACCAGISQIICGVFCSANSKKKNSRAIRIYPLHRGTIVWTASETYEIAMQCCASVRQHRVLCACTPAGL